MSYCIFIPVREIAAKNGRGVLETEMWLMFMQSGCLMNDTFRKNVMLIWITFSSEPQCNMNEEFREYQKDRIGFLALKITVLCKFVLIERRAVVCGLLNYYFF